MNAPLLLEINAYSIGLGALAVAALVVLVMALRNAPPAERLDGGAEDDAESKPSASVLMGKGATLAEVVGHEHIDRTRFLSQFVVNSKGETVGETVGFHAETVIVKKDGEFFAIATSDILFKNDQLVATADIDWDAAGEAGSRWREEMSDEMQYDDEGMPIVDEPS